MAAIYQWPDFWCTPGIVIYKQQLGVHEVVITDADSKGEALAFQNGSWQSITPSPAIIDAPNGGWWHLGNIYTGLVDTVPHNKCDLITWYGNPCAFFDDQIFTLGGYALGTENEYLPKSTFYRNNDWQSSPAPVLGACIQTVGGVDYYYILTNAAGESNPNPLKDGADDVVYRKPVSAAKHTTNDWQLVMTVPYTDYATLTTATRHPLPYGTAYVDVNGVAWYTKQIWHGISPDSYEMVLMKVDMVNATHEIYESSWDAPNWSWTETSVVTNTLEYVPYIPGPVDHTNDSTLSGSAVGEVYMYTMGGLEARYDMYMRFDHTESASSSINANGEVPLDIVGNYYGTNASPSKTWAQDTDIYLVIKKNGVTQREMKIHDFHDSFASVGTVEWPPGLDLGEEAIPTIGYTSNNVGPAVITQRNYIFVHPHAPEEDIYLERIITRDVTESVGNDSVEVGLYRGLQSAPEALYTPTTATSGSTENRKWYDDPYEVITSPSQVIPLEQRNTSDSGTLGELVKNTNPLWHRPMQQYDPFAYDREQRNNVTSPSGSYYGGGIGFASDGWGPWPTSDTSSRYAIRGYHHAAERGTDLYQPEYTIAHRAETPGGSPSYLFVLQTIYENPLYTPTATGTYVALKMIHPSGVIGAAIIASDVAASTNHRYYVISHSGTNWDTGVSYQAGETVFSELDPWQYFYTCILTHTSAITDRPEDGANWATYWARITDMGTHVRSNILTETEIKTLTGKTDADYMPEVGVINGYSSS